MVRILHIISPGSGDFGGIEAYLCGYYENMDRNKVSFDFAFCGTNTMKMKMNDPVFHNSVFKEYKALLPSSNGLRNWITLIRCIKKQLKDSHYNIVEVHSASPLIEAVCGIALKGSGVHLKIAHSHAMAAPAKSLKQKMAANACTWIIQQSYDKFFSCSYAAASVFGEKIIQSGKFQKVNNAIPAEKFSYKPNLRKKVRDSFEIRDKTIVIGHVARLSEEKNQVFLVDVFKEYHELVPDSVLWIIGEGKYRQKIESRIDSLHLKENVKMFGERNDVSELIQAMDAFVITSYSEGLCISAIESQSASLPTFVSTGVPEECKITDHFFRIPLNSKSFVWSQQISNIIKKYNRVDCLEEIIKNGYNLEQAAACLQCVYVNYIKGIDNGNEG